MYTEPQETRSQRRRRQRKAAGTPREYRGQTPGVEWTPTSMERALDTEPSGVDDPTGAPSWAVRASAEDRAVALRFRARTPQALQRETGWPMIKVLVVRGELTPMLGERVPVDRTNLDASGYTLPPMASGPVDPLAKCRPETRAAIEAMPAPKRASIPKKYAAVRARDAAAAESRGFRMRVGPEIREILRARRMGVHVAIDPRTGRLA